MSIDSDLFNHLLPIESHRESLLGVILQSLLNQRYQISKSPGAPRSASTSGTRSNDDRLKKTAPHTCPGSVYLRSDFANDFI